MKRVLVQSGYTIVEVMIVLVISGGMLSSVAAMISGQQERTEYETSVRDLENKLQDVFKNVETGLFPSNGSITCTSTPLGGAPSATTAAGKEQGTNEGCIFLGKSIQFYQDPATGVVSGYNILPIVGKRQVQASPAAPVLDVTSLDEAKPTAFFSNAPGVENLFERGKINAGLQVSDVIYLGASPVARTKGLAVLGQIGSGGDRIGTGTTFTPNDGGARVARIDVDTNPDPAIAIPKINLLNSASYNDAKGGVVVCVNRGPGSKIAAIAVGVRVNGGSYAVTGQRLATQAYFNGDAQTLGCTS